MNDDRWIELLIEEEVGGAKPPDLAGRLAAQVAGETPSASDPRRPASTWIAAAIALFALSVVGAIALFGETPADAPGGPQDPERELPVRPAEANEFAASLPKLTRIDVSVQRPFVGANATVRYIAARDARLSITDPAEIGAWRRDFASFSTRGPSSVLDFVIVLDMAFADHRMVLRAHLTDPCIEAGATCIAPGEALERRLRRLLMSLEHGVPAESRVCTAAELGSVDPACRALVLREAGDADLGPLRKLGQLQELIVVDGGNTTIGDAGLRTISSLPHLRRLKLPRLSATDAGMASLATLADLEELQLSFHESASVTPAGMTRLAELAKLRWLELIHWRLHPDVSDSTERALAAILRRRELQRLRLSGCEVDLGVFHDLVRQTRPRPGVGRMHLSRLELHDTTVTDLAILRDLPALESLELSRCIWNGPRAAVAQLGRTKLRELHIDRVTTIGGLFDWGAVADIASLERLSWTRNLGVADLVDDLSRLPRLRRVDFSGTDLADPDLLELVGVPSLTRVVAIGTALTDDGVAAFREARPGVRIER